jgi:adenosylcobinamide-GDP ribazoletransferase
MSDQTIPDVRAGIRQALGGFRPAVALLTRLPIGSAPVTVHDQLWAPVWFPIVGAGIGAISGLVVVAFGSAGEVPAACLAVIASLALTGALHEDGLADTADALGGADTRERLFAILKDSRSGAFGVSALSITLLLRVSLLASLGASAGYALVLVHTWSRLAPVALMSALPYVTDPMHRKNGSLERPTQRRALIASAFPLLVLIIWLSAGFLDSVDALVFSIFGALSTLACGQRFAARAGGYTGDFLGASEQVAECALLLALAL